MIFVLFKNLKYQTLTFICLSLAVGLVVAFGPWLLGGRVGLLPLFLIDLIVKSFLGVRILTVVFKYFAVVW